MLTKLDFELILGQRYHLKRSINTSDDKTRHSRHGADSNHNIQQINDAFKKGLIILWVAQGKQGVE